MELVSIYLLSHIPIERKNISNSTFMTMKQNGWYNDTRNNTKFTMLNKRFNIEGQWYRVLVRFAYSGDRPALQEEFELSTPVPFLITTCEQNEEGSLWRDTKTYHGPKLKNVQGYLKENIPMELILKVYEELKQYVQYKDKEMAIS